MRLNLKTSKDFTENKILKQQDKQDVFISKSCATVILSSNVLYPRALVPWMCSTSLLTILWKNFLEQSDCTNSSIDYGGTRSFSNIMAPLAFFNEGVPDHFSHILVRTSIIGSASL